jgi:hypothetical protein
MAFHEHAETLREKLKTLNIFFSEVAPQWQQAQKTGGAQ